MADRIGGSFAPPITDEMMAAWADLIPTTSGMTRAALEQLHALVAAHREESGPIRARGYGAPHPSGRGTVRPLSATVRDRVTPLVPSTEDRAVAAGLFDSLNREEVHRNTQKVAVWHKKLNEMMAVDPEAEPLGRNAPSDIVMVKAAALTEKYWDQLPYPELEPAPLRDMAFHLLWYANELSLGREPMTNDQLEDAR